MVIKEEREYYEKFKWCLMPFLSFGEILDKLNWLIHVDLDSMPQWCQKEWRINLYMLSAAVADIADDYLVRGVINLSKMNDYISLMNKPVRFLRGISILKSRMAGKWFDKRVREWRTSWSEWLVLTCKGLLTDELTSENKVKEFKDILMPLLHDRFPKNLMAMRARIPAAYRSQDLTHHDFLALSKKYTEKYYDRECPHVIIGLRTAGSFIAPLICANLREEGFQQALYLTIRPKGYIHPWDEEQLKKNIKKNNRFIVVDEPPNSGKSIARCVEILKCFGVDNERIAILVPVHPAGGDWLDASLKHFLGNTDIMMLEHGEWYKEKLMDLEQVRNSVKPYFASLGFDDVKVDESEETKNINKKLIQNPERAYHVRLKKVFRVTPLNGSRGQDRFLLMAKSVGWGWLGYHAALSAYNLSGYVPKIFGVQNGIMYSEWIENSKEPCHQGNSQDNIPRKLSDYISRRTNYLKLKENPMPFLNAYREGGLQSIAIILSNVFGSKISKLKRGWVRNELEKLPCPFPALIDSRMLRDEWVLSEKGLLKTDYEHHGFSKTASHNIADPAYDLATAMLEFELLDEEKEKLVNIYSEKTGDQSIRERLFYYKLLAASEAMEESINKLNMIKDSAVYPGLNRKYIVSWNFLVSETMHHTASFCEGETAKCWGTPMFVMDIDDVLDKNIFGYPSATANGVRSLSLLRAHRVCSVVNTARSFKEVKDYCKYYGLEGGIAEYGSVIWDDIEGKEEILVSPEATHELEILCDALTKIPGIFVNPFYQYSIRAYCYNKQRTTPVPDAAIGELFSRLGIKHLIAKKSYIDTAIFDASVDKGKALLKLKQLKGLNSGNIGAVGDTESDLPMLIVADHGFLVDNSTIQLKRKARNFGILIVKSSFQSGLLESVNMFLHENRSSDCKKCQDLLKGLHNNRDFYWQLMEISDMSKFQLWARAFDRSTFEIFRE